MRVLDCQDLVALEACYRITCIGRFSLNKRAVMQPQLNGLYVMQSKKVLIFFANALNQRQRYIQCLKFRVKLSSL